MIGNPTSFSQALQGKLAGVQVNSNDGAPGSGMSITIRDAKLVFDQFTTIVYRRWYSFRCG